VNVIQNHNVAAAAKNGAVDRGRDTEASGIVSKIFQAALIVINPYLVSP
jgi:hypothetical protein